MERVDHSDEAHRAQRANHEGRHRRRSRSRSRDRTKRGQREGALKKRHRSRDRDGHFDIRKAKKRDEKKRRKEKDAERGMAVVDDDIAGMDMWVEKPITAGAASSIPTAEAYALTSHASQPSLAPSPPSRSITTGIPRIDDDLQFKTMEDSGGGMTDGYGDDGGANGRTMQGGVDFFSSLGTEMRGARVREEKERRRLEEEDRRQPKAERLGYAGDKPLDARKSASPPPPPKKLVPGAPGFSWRMTKLRRTFELADEESRPLEEVALERYGSMEAWEAVLEERRVLDEREQRARGGSGGSTPRPNVMGARGLVFNQEGSRPGSRTGFRRPNSEYAPSPRGTPGPAAQSNLGPSGSRAEALRRQSSTPGPSTPIPSVLTPPIRSNSFQRLLVAGVPTATTLNKLQAALLRAKLTGSPNVADFEQEYAEALKKVREAGGPGEEPEAERKVEIIPTLDGRGRLYDIGKGGGDERPLGPGNRRKKEPKVETHDPKTGEMLRLNADDDTATLGDLVRHERFGGGAADQKNMDAEVAKRIMTDAKFENDLEYLDDNAECLARKKMKTDSSKRLFAIRDYARTKKALADCPFCPSDDGRPPRAAVIASGTSTFLACTEVEELVEGHCLIVPMHHHLSSLEADDDVWDEIKNFMKCLMRMFADRDQGVVFFETILGFKHQKHTYIEAVPLPWDLFSDAPAYFRESIYAAESEWSQNKKLIDFSKRPGGFRRSMVPNLPYFMVQWDYKGEKGYGHVIEGMGESAAHGGEGDNGEQDAAAGVEEENRGGEIQRWFAQEIIGNLLDLEPRKWRRPKRMDQWQGPRRVKIFLMSYKQYDWTSMLQSA